MLEYLEISLNLVLETLEYFGSSTCSGEQYLPMLTGEFAKNAFQWRKDVWREEGKCKILKPGSNILLMHRH